MNWSRKGPGFTDGCRVGFSTVLVVLMALFLAGCSASNRIQSYGVPSAAKDGEQWRIFAKRQGVLSTLYVSKAGSKNVQPILSGTLNIYSPVITDDGHYAVYITGQNDDYKLWFQEVDGRRNNKPLQVEQYHIRPQTLSLDTDSRNVIVDRGLVTEAQYTVRDLVLRLRKTN